MKTHGQSGRYPRCWMRLLAVLAIALTLHESRRCGSGLGHSLLWTLFAGRLAAMPIRARADYRAYC